MDIKSVIKTRTDDTFKGLHISYDNIEKMSDKRIKPTIQRCATIDSVTIEGPELPNTDAYCVGKIRKSVSMDSGEAEVVKKSLTASTGSLIRRSVRRRTSKRLGRPEPEFGHDTVTYEKIQERVLQERAVTNAIDALQERWRMLMFMYDDCVALNEKRKERKLRKLCVRRQFELLTIVIVFLLICLPIILVLVLITR
ncbi:uncharacterized protein LOC128547576 [Mercenaria mercenaria]|uniref:uncharacterized protein LOC128547576 n=1 Tax=Mercenaria mercenaria TaxID=6596 RepID=UPI00234F5E75|nr:uncharacterized protein LOC128547576 [Mercenaria mercenaria]